jgi:hypothetical protein
MDKFEEWLEECTKVMLIDDDYDKGYIRAIRICLAKYRELNSTQMTHSEPVDTNNS